MRQGVAALSVLLRLQVDKKTIKFFIVFNSIPLTTNCVPKFCKITHFFYLFNTYMYVCIHSDTVMMSLFFVCDIFYKYLTIWQINR